MANADFNPKQTGTPGGFDAGSYREKAKPEQAWKQNCPPPSPGRPWPWR